MGTTMGMPALVAPTPPGTRSKFSCFDFAWINSHFLGPPHHLLQLLDPQEGCLGDWVLSTPAWWCGTAGGVGQLVVQALGLSETQPYLLLWALYCQQSGATNVATLSLLGALGFLPTTRWVKPGLGAVVTNPVSSCG